MARRKGSEDDRVRGSNVTVRRGEEGDAEGVSTLCQDVFRQTYGAAIPLSTLDAYVARTFATDALRTSLADVTIHYWIAVQDAALAGVCKLAIVDAPPCVRAHQPIELVHLYVAPAHQQKGIGAALLTAAVESLSTSAHDLLWLCVWEQNMDAIRFYQRWGFEQVGWHNIWVEQVVFRDLMLVRKLKKGTTDCTEYTDFPLGD